MPDLFAVPIFFIVFRETVEAAIIIGVLLSFVQQLMTSGQFESDNGDEARAAGVKKLLKRMRVQIWAGALAGFLVALAIGAAFIAVFYTKLVDLWAQTEQIWEGAFSLLAALIILVMGTAFLKMDQSRVKWRFKLARAFDRGQAAMSAADAPDKGSRSEKWALFLLPFITVVREGLEAVVFVGGVSLGYPAKSIPIPVVVGLIVGGLVGFIIYRTGTSTTLHWFLIVSTSILFLIGAGLFSKAIGFFEYYNFAKGVGGDVAETGDGPGSFRVQGNVWHLTYGNPEVGSPTTNGGWQIFNSILGWNNTASIGSVLGYVFYWLFAMAVLLWMKWKEGRMTMPGRSKRAAGEQAAANSASQSQDGHPEDLTEKSSPEKEGAGLPTL